tara:strand:+ start:101 stop:349 length:249 start_codon:yes stop_codon:yes gene_type:complete
MPKYMIHCSTVRSYWLTVEAPNLEAVELFYGGCNGDEFAAGDEGGWDLDDIEEVDSLSDHVDLQVNEEGTVIEPKEVSNANV